MTSKIFELLIKDHPPIIKDLPGDKLVPISPLHLLSTQNETNTQFINNINTQTNSTKEENLSKFKNLVEFTRTSRILTDGFWSHSVPEISSDPKLVHINPLILESLGPKLLPDLAQQINNKLKSRHNNKDLESEINTLEKLFSGNVFPREYFPISYNYGGHQFGSWANQLGDGRAMTIFSLVTNSNSAFEVQLKGSGRTIFSRFGDGYALLSSSVREYIVAEHMAALGIPTTRSLTLLTTGGNVLRENEIFQGSKNQNLGNGAIVSRLASSWIRFGSFEYAYYNQKQGNGGELTRNLADFVIKHQYPHLEGSKTKYLELFTQIVDSTASLIAKWMAVGFCHGVMNTDNMSIIGITLDYGPFGFLNKYDTGWICNESDHSGRYAYNEQPKVGLWNLMRLGGVLYDIIADEYKNTHPNNENNENGVGKQVAEILNGYGKLYNKQYHCLMCKKMGVCEESNDYTKVYEELVYPFLEILEKYKMDYTISFRMLSKTIMILKKHIEEQKPNLDKIPNTEFDLETNKELNSWLSTIMDNIMTDSNLNHLGQQALSNYFSNVFYKYHISKAKNNQVGIFEYLDTVYSTLNKTNPQFVFRNWLSIDIFKGGEADTDTNILGHDDLDIDKFNELFSLLTTHVYTDAETLKEEYPNASRYAGPAPEWSINTKCSCTS
ncbi:hypothetical protein BB559_004930 [Furculomyces boomerangus]|nr:hypothetical protein BB559_004930 [Furculomyces boomerangus]